MMSEMQKKIEAAKLEKIKKFFEVGKLYQVQYSGYFSADGGGGNVFYTDIEDDDSPWGLVPNKSIFLFVGIKKYSAEIDLYDRTPHKLSYPIVLWKEKTWAISCSGLSSLEKIGYSDGTTTAMVVGA